MIKIGTIFKYFFIVTILFFTSCISPELKRDRLFDAIKNSNYDYVSSVDEVNFKDTYNRTPLMKAIRKNDLKLVRLLLEKKANVSARDKFKDTALMKAVSEGNLEIVKLLIKYDANINDTNKYGWSVLMRAISSRNEEIVKYLIDKGVNVEYTKKNGDNALIWASGDRFYYGEYRFQWIHSSSWGAHHFKSKGGFNNFLILRSGLKNNLKMIKLLIEAGVNINHHNRFGIDALISSVAVENINSINWLLENGADINQVYYRNSALIKAAKNGNIKIVQYLIKKGADPTICNTKHYNAYVYAIKNNRKYVSSYLSKLPHNCTNYYKTVLYDLVKENDYKTIEKIDLQKDFMPEEIDSALIKSIKSNKIESFKIILKSGKFKNKQKIFLASLKKYNREMIELLYKNGFSKVAESSVCWSSNNQPERDLLSSNGSLSKKGCTNLLNKDNINFYKYLFKEISIDKLNNIPKYLYKKERITPLMIASLWQDSALIDLILSKDKKTLNKTNKDGYNALIYSLQNGDNKINDKLIKLGIDTNINDAEGKTIIMHAIRNNAKKFAYRFVQKLKRDYNLYYSVKSWSLLKYASRYDNPKIIEFLIENEVEYPKSIEHDQLSPLVLASSYSSTETLRLLLKNKAKVNESFNGDIPIIRAIRKNRFNNIKFLIESGANLNRRYYNLWTPLMYSARYSNLNIFNLLLTNTKNKTQISKSKLNLLMLAVLKKDNVGVLKRIYERRKILKIKLDDKNILGKTALIFAVRSNNINSVKYLLSKGADPMIKDIENHDSFYFAQTRGYNRVLQELNKYKK